MNRKQRRTQNAKSSKTTQDPDQIPLALPPEFNEQQSTKAKAKTLYEIAAERQAALTTDSKGFDLKPTSENVVNVAIGPDGEIRPLDGSKLPTTKEQDQEDDIDEPLIETLMLASSLSALHFTLEALTVHQYAEELKWMPIFWHTLLQAFPILTLLVHFAHGHVVSLKPGERGRRIIDVVKQIAFVGIANVAGCYLVYLTNDKGYMAVMKNAPSIGTIWVWSVIELGLAGALAGVAGPGFYAWYYGIPQITKWASGFGAVEAKEEYQKVKVRARTRSWEKLGPRAPFVHKLTVESDPTASSALEADKIVKQAVSGKMPGLMYQIVGD